MLNPRHLAAFALLATLGCHAKHSTAQPPAGQAPAAATKPLPVEEARRVEVLLRQKANLPPGSEVHISGRKPSEVPGYDLISATITDEGNTSHPINFLLSTDGKTLAQFTKYDISANPRDFLSADGRPARGGPPSAPVLIVGFDDLECPYCARLHASIFPAITNRYGDKVRIVYKDFPLDSIHPWAQHAAVDVNCLAAQSPTGYWNLVDTIHSQSSTIGGSSDPKDTEKTLPRANEQLDKLTRDQGAQQHVDAAALNACITRQDVASITASKKQAESLSLDSAPVLFINGDKIDGAVPIEFIFNIIDNALVAAGQTPPPPFVAPKPLPTTISAPATTNGPAK